MILHTFGDSHSYIGWNFSIDSLEIKHKKSGPYTMARFGMEKLNLLDIKNEGVNENDIVCFCFGEIDCRTHLGKPQNFKIYKDIIDKIVSQYFEAIQINISRYNNITTLVFNIVPAFNVTSEFIQNTQWPHIGSNEERKIITLYANSKLREYSQKYKYIFFDVYDNYCDKDGFLNPELSDTTLIHIGNGVYMEKFLKKLLNELQNN
jgi:hypothetical protein